jgi:hypothetical protein
MTLMDGDKLIAKVLLPEQRGHRKKRKKHKKEKKK